MCAKLFNTGQFAKIMQIKWNMFFSVFIYMCVLNLLYIKNIFPLRNLNPQIKNKKPEIKVWLLVKSLISLIREGNTELRNEKKKKIIFKTNNTI